jgi:hypothetical protein
MAAAAAVVLVACGGGADAIPPAAAFGIHSLACADDANGDGVDCAWYGGAQCGDLITGRYTGPSEAGARADAQERLLRDPAADAFLYCQQSNGIGLSEAQCRCLADQYGACAIDGVEVARACLLWEPAAGDDGSREGVHTHACAATEEGGTACAILGRDHCGHQFGMRFATGPAGAEQELVAAFERGLHPTTADVEASCEAVDYGSLDVSHDECVCAERERRIECNPDGADIVERCGLW